MCDVLHAHCGVVWWCVIVVCVGDCMVWRCGGVCVCAGAGRVVVLGDAQRVLYCCAMFLVAWRATPFGVVVLV